MYKFLAISVMLLCLTTANGNPPSIDVVIPAPDINVIQEQPKVIMQSSTVTQYRQAPVIQYREVPVPVQQFSTVTQYREVPTVRYQMSQYRTVAPVTVIRESNACANGNCASSASKGKNKIFFKYRERN